MHTALCLLCIRVLHCSVHCTIGDGCSHESKCEAALPGRQLHVPSEYQKRTAPADQAARTCSLSCVTTCHVSACQLTFFAPIASIGCFILISHAALLQAQPWADVY